MKIYIYKTIINHRPPLSVMLAMPTNNHRTAVEQVIVWFSGYLAYYTGSVRPRWLILSPLGLAGCTFSGVSSWIWICWTSQLLRSFQHEDFSLGSNTSSTSTRRLVRPSRRPQGERERFYSEIFGAGAVDILYPYYYVRARLFGILQYIWPTLLQYYVRRTFEWFKIIRFWHCRDLCRNEEPCRAD